jgi:hypothetical protein
MTAIETADGRVQDTVEHVATITALPARHEPEALPALLPTWTQVATLVTPPDIWTDADGFWRKAGVAWALVAMVATTPLYLLAWIIERPTRFLIAATVAALIKLAL